jgi:hypothetical protein
MSESNETEQERSSTSPPEGDTGEATKPPANPDVDQDAVDRGQEKLDQAGGGH